MQRLNLLATRARTELAAVRARLAAMSRKPSHQAWRQREVDRLMRDWCEAEGRPANDPTPEMYAQAVWQVQQMTPPPRRYWTAVAIVFTACAAVAVLAAGLVIALSSSPATSQPSGPALAMTGSGGIAQDTVRGIRAHNLPSGVEPDPPAPHTVLRSRPPVHPTRYLAPSAPAHTGGNPDPAPAATPAQQATTQPPQNPPPDPTSKPTQTCVTLFGVAICV